MSHQLFGQVQQLSPPSGRAWGEHRDHPALHCQWGQNQPATGIDFMKQNEYMMEIMYQSWSLGDKITAKQLLFGGVQLACVWSF